MSETSSFHEHFDVQSEGGESSQAKSFRFPKRLSWQDHDDNDNDFSGGQEAAPGSENSKPPSINTATISLNEESEQSQAAAVTAKGKQSDETIENLVSLFRDFLEAAPNPAACNSTHNTQRNTTGRKRIFGLTKGLSPETGSNNRYDYEQKYPRDRFGEETADNARVWLTYLDEAESFDRERVEGWKETADVLLVFAGLFSGVITTFVSQASQSLRQDNTQVSVSLLFETVQILRAQFSGVPISHVPNSTLTPTSPFTPSTNAFLVNGLWFTSLAITLSTALFAVLAKQWLYYYLSSITGTAREKARARQLRFKGFELWKVGAIVDLLPILLHLAVGIFLTGIIILLFPLDIRVAWAIVIITGITYTLYFISVILPIRYPECPYTTSFTIYVGILFFFLQGALRCVSAILDQDFLAVRRTTIFQAVWRRINFQVLRSIQRLLCYIHGLFRHGFLFILKLVRLKRRGFRRFRPTIFPKGFPKFRWREENIKKAVENAAFLDFEALDWLYATSPNRSVRRIIARCAVHPSLSQQFGAVVRHDLRQTLEVGETNVVDLHYGLCLDVLAARKNSWHLLRSIPDVVESQLEEAEYQSYSCIADNVISHAYDQTLNNVIKDNLKLPLIMWRCFLDQAPRNPTMAAHILIHERYLFSLKSERTCETIRNVGVVSFKDINKERGCWKFDYLFRFFLDDTEPDHSLDEAFEMHYLLLLSVYRNLTSDRPLIANKKQRRECLSNLFEDFLCWPPSPNSYTSFKQFLAFFKDICCTDEFRSESMTHAGYSVARCMGRIWNSMDTDRANFPFTECHDLSLIYWWYSGDLGSHLIQFTPPMFVLLFVPQNRQHLSTILLKDLNPVPHFAKCFQNVRNCLDINRTGTYANLMDLLKYVNPEMPLFAILYNSFVLVQLWKLLVFSKLDAKKFFLRVKSKLDQEKLDELYATMTEQARPEDWEVSSFHAWDCWATDARNALERSAREFGQIIGVSHPRSVSTTEQSASEGAASTDYDIEEHAHWGPASPSERKGFHSIANSIKKAFGSVWSKTRIHSARFTSETELQDL